MGAGNWYRMGRGIGSLFPGVFLVSVSVSGLRTYLDDAGIRTPLRLFLKPHDL